MLIKDARRRALFVGPIIVILYLGWACFHSTDLSSKADGWWDHVFPPVSKPDPELAAVAATTAAAAAAAAEGRPTAKPTASPTPAPDQAPDQAPDRNTDGAAPESHHEVFSASTTDRKYFRIVMGEEEAMNPNIIPHPAMDDTWVVVAQRQGAAETMHFLELVCYASFDGDVLRCNDTPSNLPVEPTQGITCDGELAVLAINVGPHDARVFYGPNTPYTVYGSNSRFTCFGQWVHNFGTLMEWQVDDATAGTTVSSFTQPTEMQRPGPYGRLEKNWFLFWDDKKDVYAHYGVAPTRAFAKLNPDGSVGEDLAPLAVAAGDDKCLDKYLPKFTTESESIHQATNSLSITMCKRADPSCLADESNTFLFTIFQHKSYHEWHSVYEPYVMLFKQQAPFEVHAISQKPIWIHGRSVTDSGQDEMFYVVSMSWKARGQKYHGYLDDVLFVAFGIEDKDTAGIDVVASDLLEGLGLCSSV